MCCIWTFPSREDQGHGAAAPLRSMRAAFACCFSEEIPSTTDPIKISATRIIKTWYINYKKSPSSINDGKASMHHEKHTLNLAKYKEELWKCIEPLLEVYGLVGTETYLDSVTKAEEIVILKIGGGKGN